MERFKIITAVHLILIENDRVLLLRRYNTGYEDGNYSVPAGHAEEDEDVIKAMQREAFEEIGIKIKKEDLKTVHVMQRKAPDRESIDYFYFVKNMKVRLELWKKINATM